MTLRRVILPVIVAITCAACGPPLKEYGVVQSASVQEVCYLRRGDGERFCVTGGALSRSVGPFSPGDCVRLQWEPEGIGNSVLSVRPDQECSPTVGP